MDIAPSFEFLENERGYALTGCSAEGITDITVPSKYKGVPVIAIGDGAFSGNTELVKVTLHDGIKYIGAHAFSGCSKLEMIGFENGADVGAVEEIAHHAFHGCTSLGSVGFIASVKHIGEYAFHGCARLTSVKLGELISEIPISAFENCIGLESTVISDSVSVIHSSAFAVCGKLASVDLGKGVKKIDAYAFRGCSSLVDAVIPESVTSLSESAFYGCGGILHEELGITYAGRWLVSCDREVVRARIRRSTVGICGAAFSNCTRLVCVDIPRNVRYIGDHAFDNCKALECVNIEDLAVWCEIDFAHTRPCNSDHCSNPLSYAKRLRLNGADIKTLEIPDGVRRIGCNAFYNCASLTSVVIPESVVEIGENAFRKCKSLTTVMIGAGVEKIEKNAFSRCNSLTTITVAPKNETYKSIGNCILGRGESGEFTTVLVGCAGSRIPTDKGITEIGERAFYNCDSLTEIEIPEGVRRIGHYAFYHCSAIKRLKLPESIEEIGHFAFGECNTLELLSIYASTAAVIGGISTEAVLIMGSDRERVIRKDAFSDFEVPERLIIGEGVHEIEAGAFAKRKKLKSVEISECVEHIGMGAFSACSFMEEITVPFTGGHKIPNDFSESALFGYIFGSEYDPRSTRITQVYDGGERMHTVDYYLPVALRKVTFTGTAVLDYSFNYCTGITDIIFASPITYIGDRAFLSCRGLLSVTLPRSLASIGDEAFRGCYRLSEVINHSPLRIRRGSDDHGAVAYSALRVTSLPHARSRIKKVDGYIFRETLFNVYLTGYLGNDADIVLPKTYCKRRYSVAPSAFNGMQSITSVVIPDGVRAIGENAFANCAALTSVMIPRSVRRIGFGAFTDCPEIAIHAKAVRKPVIGWHKAWKDARGVAIFDHDSKILERERKCWKKERLKKEAAARKAEKKREKAEKKAKNN